MGTSSRGALREIYTLYKDSSWTGELYKGSSLANQKLDQVLAKNTNTF